MWRCNGVVYIFFDEVKILVNVNKILSKNERNAHQIQISQHDLYNKAVNLLKLFGIPLQNTGYIANGICSRLHYVLFSAPDARRSESGADVPWPQELRHIHGLLPVIAAARVRRGG
jgi:hypothetical protein